MKAQRGFTLIEILVAVMIAAILAVMSYGAMSQALSHREVIRARTARLAALQSTMRSLVQDLSQMQPRPVRDTIGDTYLPALAGNTAASPEIVFTRAGWSNPAGTQRSTLQRVHYVLRDGALYREYWLVLDAQLDPLPKATKILDDVTDFQVRYMDDGHNWQTSWPPPSASGATTPTERQKRWRPVAVEVTLTLKDWGIITRTVEVAG